MKIAALISEFNPLHNGHKYIIDRMKEDGYSVVCILSDNFVQRGDISIISKFDRASLAVECGADLCVELPCPWSMSFAENFAFGALSLIKNLKCVDKIYFGSECGDIELLKKAAGILSGNSLNIDLKKQINENGETYAKALQTALERNYPELKGIISEPNNTLGIEYINAAKKLNINIDFETVKRIGSGHNSNKADEFTSSTFIRQCISTGNTEEIKNAVPAPVYEKLKFADTANLLKLDTAILAYLRTLKKENLANLPDVSEGLENRVYSAIRMAHTFDELITEAKSKRYTLARIRRICLSAFLDIDNSFIYEEVPYLKVLAVSETGKSIIKKMSGKTDIPIVTSKKDYDKLEGFAKKTAEAVIRATDLYSLAFEHPYPCGLEYTAKIFK